MMLDFPCLAEYAIIYDGTVTMTLTHGHNADRIASVLPKCSLLLCGHTHVPKVEKFDGYTYLNPGSVSIPKENSPHGFILYEEEKFKWIDLENQKEYMEFALKR